MFVLILRDTAVSELNVVSALRARGFELVVRGLDDPRAAADSRCRLIILERALVDDEILARITETRASDELSPLLLVTSEQDVSAKLRAFEAGVDECVSFACDPAEFVGRVRALLRRSQSYRPSRIRVGPIQIDEGEQRAYVNSELVDLTTREFSLLRQLALRPGEVVSRRDIHSAVWRDKVADSNVIEVHVGRLRQKLGQAAENLRTVRGVGYCLVPSPHMQGKPSDSALHGTDAISSHEHTVAAG